MTSLSRMTRQEESIELLDSLPSHDDVKNRINDAFDALFTVDEDGNLRPYVCVVCDEFIDNPDKDLEVLLVETLYSRRHKLAWNTYLDCEERVPEVEEYYTVQKGVDCLYVGPKIPDDAQNLHWIKDLAMSRNATIIKNKRGQFGFSCCGRCKRAINNKNSKYYTLAIANNHFVGATPTCLLELSEVELALISPVKSHGYCFSYVGGRQRNLQGTLVFMRVKRREIVRGVMQLEALGLTKNVIVICTGRMTKEQRKRVKQKKTIRTDKVIAAVNWLCENNPLWRSKVDLQKIREELEGAEPTFIDLSNEIEGEDANVERKEVFSCYYPDGATTETQGGWHQPGAFREFVEKLQANNTEVEFVCDLQRDFVNDKETDEFLESCLLQFPYGIGGVRQRRIRSDGSFTQKKTDVDNFITHMSKISQKVFHQPLFVLMLYNLSMKSKLLQRAFLQVPEKVQAESIANGLNYEDLSHAVNERRRVGNKNVGTQASRSLLNAVDACSRAIAHTDEAAQSARSTGEAMQHHFGMPSIFLTVTYDDDNTIVLQALSGKYIDSDREVSSYSDVEVENMMEQRRSIRISFPGLSGIGYEMLNRVLFREVIGWDIDTGTAVQDKVGIFGTPYAVGLAVEEQGRKTPHGHITIWIEGFNTLLSCATEGSTFERKLGVTTVNKYADHVLDTSLFAPTESRGSHTRKLQVAFDHACSINKSRRRLPVVVDDQQLRNLRHKMGYRETDGKFATCPHCDKMWTYEEMVAGLVINHHGIKDSVQMETDTSEVPIARMKAMIVQYQRTKNCEDTVSVDIINACYQHHKSCHVKGCFHCNGKRKHICGPSCECRFRLPDRKRRKFHNVRKMNADEVNWYSWRGVQEKMTWIEIVPTRNQYDLFQNVSCKAISSSKFACNNNVSVMTPGPVAQYQFKYCFKATQKDDTAAYEHVVKRIKSCIRYRKHEDDRKEAQRLIIAAAFAHQKSNIIGASMASYIIRNESRFYFSHRFVYCPLSDLVKLLAGGRVGGTIRTKGENTYFENAALHYLCRNAAELENVNAAEFFTQYYITNNSQYDEEEDECFPMEPDTGHFQHPAASKDKSKVNCFAAYRKEHVLLKVSQWTFPDTACFSGDLLTSVAIDSEMDRYAKLILILFFPFRCSDDLKLPNVRFPHVQKIRQVYFDEMRLEQTGEKPIVFTKENIRFLQNLQDTRSNCLRLPKKKDDLQSATLPFVPADPDIGGFTNEEISDDEEDEGVDLEEEFEWLLGTDDEHDTEQDIHTSLPSSYRLRVQRDMGKSRAGYNTALKPPTEPFDVVRPTVERSGRFVVDVPTRNLAVPADTEDMIRCEQNGRRQYSMKSIVKVLFTRREVNSVAQSQLFGSRAPEVQLANGSPGSIINWAELAGLDSYQRRAFEIMTASFVLTFYENPEHHEGDEDSLATMQNTQSTSYRSRYRVTYNNLRELQGIHQQQLIMLLHGPGGSGKSTAIDLAQSYAKEFCKTLGHPFNSRTMILTALSGVAATLISGETAQKCFGMMKRKEFEQEEIEAFVDTRLIIIDEISFAEACQIEKINECLQVLMQSTLNHTKGLFFGGVHMIFSGDFSQLEPPGPGRKPIYDVDPIPEFQGAVNCFIELKGMHRFCNDMEWGLLLRRFREGQVTEEDIDVINAACLAKYGKEIPRGIQTACYSNKDRNAINSLVFSQYCSENRCDDGTVKDAAIIFMGNVELKNKDNVMKSVTSKAFLRHFYENCGDAAIDLGKSRRGVVDTALKLYYDCPLLLTENEAVSEGQANGSRVTLVSINRKTGEQPFYVSLDDGARVEGYRLEQIESLTVRHLATNIQPPLFDVKPRNYSKFQATIPDAMHGTEILTMSGRQFPIVSNNATTGHKLQGASVDDIFVNDWYYGANWVYVVLSRVRTMRGLFIRNALDRNVAKYSVKENMVSMIANFREKHLQGILSDTVYSRLKQCNAFVDTGSESLDDQ